MRENMSPEDIKEFDNFLDTAWRWLYGNDYCYRTCWIINCRINRIISVL
jgi:hypothetical protein